MRTQTFYSVIASGGTVGGSVGIIGARSATLFISTVTSAELRLQGSVDGTSFAPIQSSTQSLWLRRTSVGSFAVALDDEALAFAYLKPVFSVAQTDNRTITFGVKL